MKTIPVLSKNNKPLMPTSPSKARKLIKNNEAIPFFKMGIFSIKLKKETDNNVQSVVAACDPGSKFEAYSVKSENGTHLNIQSNAIDWVKDNVKTKSQMRRGRRFRKTPCRKPRWSNRENSRRSNRVPPSSLARWNLKLQIIKNINKLYPIVGVQVEDIKAPTVKGPNNKKNLSFSPLETGKNWFYNEVRKFTKLGLNQGWQTAKWREEFDLEKSSDKGSGKFDTHCVDTWTMANKLVGGHNTPDNEKMMYLTPIKKNRRSLHKLQRQKGGARPRTGGTRSLGFTKGSIIRHRKPTKILLRSNKKGLFLIGGNNGSKLSLLSINGSGPDNGRVSRSINPKDIRFLSYNRFKIKI